MQKLIDSIDLPSGLRKLSSEDLVQVAEELREELISTILSCGGHFASSLGVTELTVALHHCFNTPHDKLLWDVGHQGYIHKMLTGRRAEMPQVRQKGGISGFLKRCESEYDCFGAGHAGTSLSAAIGMLVAENKSQSGNYVVPVIGDGAMTCGMAFEALNHAGSLGLKNLIVVLNDNEMSISPNVGAISWLFSRAVTSKTSTKARSGFKNLYRKGYVPEVVYRAIDKAEEATQGFFSGAAMLFESFGFRYIGPVDGHNMDDVVTALEHARQQDVPVLIHAYTVKGKGYKQAEGDPVKWHAVSPPKSLPAKSPAISLSHNNNSPTPAVRAQTGKKPTYTSVFARSLIELADIDDRIVGITAAMAGGTGLDLFQEKHSEKFFDVGICEQHAVTFAAGLACEGYKPVCAIYSTFLQRAYDQVVHDVCIQNLPVIFAMDRSGVVGNDGETHQGVFDIAFLRTIPSLVIMSPKDENELRHMLYTASRHNGPTAIRYPRGEAAGVAMDSELKELPIGEAEVVKRGCDVMLIGFGPITAYALEAASKLELELGLSVTVVNARYAKPLDEKLFEKELVSHSLVATVEDHALSCGFGSALLEMISERGLQLQAPLLRFGIQDQFVTHASQKEQHEMNKCDSESIYQKIFQEIQKNTSLWPRPKLSLHSR